MGLAGATHSRVTLVNSEVALADASVAALWKNTKGRWGSGDDDIDEIRIDASTNVLNVIDYVHHEIHDGSHYYIQGFAELNNLGTLYIKLVTPNTGKWAHFLYSITSSGICTSYFDEDAVGGMTGGSGVIPINNNRNSSNLSALVFTSGVSVATSYTKRLESSKWGAAGFKETVGGGTGREDELILKQNTTYLRSFVSGADNNIIQFKASWYEHSDRH